MNSEVFNGFVRKSEQNSRYSTVFHSPRRAAKPAHGALRGVVLTKNLAKFMREPRRYSDEIEDARRRLAAPRARHSKCAKLLVLCALRKQLPSPSGT